jgi:Flp pilus assembly pilin Flp
MYTNFIPYLKALCASAKAEQGQTLVEYALILVLVSIVGVGLLTTLGVDVVGDLGGLTGAL